MALRFFSVLFLLGVTSAYVANPCGFNRAEGNFRPAGCPNAARNYCAATVPFSGKRSRFCTPTPPGRAGCICPAVFLPVCCRVRRNKFITQTFTSGNACGCGCFNNSEVLFEGECSRPPGKPLPCTLEFNPTCCYVKKFDLTFTAGNPCECTSPAGGVIVPKSLCKT